MEDSFNSYSNNKKYNSSEIRINTGSIYNNKNRNINKTNSFFDYENNTNNNPEFNDCLGNLDIKYNFENNNNDNFIINDNDISSEDEYESKIKYMKIGILTAKLNILIKIFYSKIQKNFFYLISKIKLKIECNKIFLQGDNFLYSKLKSKTSDVNKYNAFKKLIYIFRKNKYDTLIKKSYFNKWKIIKNNFLYDEKEKTKLIKIVKFCSILISIFNKRLEKDYQSKYFISKWDIFTNYDDIQKIRIRKAMLILVNLYTRKIRRIFKNFQKII